MKSAQPNFPLSTYRLQFHKDFTFKDGAALAGYLKELGVSHLYASPVLEAAAGSTHGYDVQDFSKVSDERGGEAALQNLDKALGDAGLSMMLDIVPNHMAANPHNPYWRDVLANGRASRYWTLFDMRVPDGERIHLPVLAEEIAALFGKGDLAVNYAADALQYYETQYPLASGTPRFDGALTEEQFGQVLAAQNYEFVPWTEVKEKVSYRRFFDVTTLIGVRIEDEANFKLAHAKLFEMMRTMSSIKALRCDHIDGLAAPQAYLERLAAHGLPVWVEKILGREEKLVNAWPIEGTTGYEFIDQLNQLFTDAEGFRMIEDFWRKEIDGEWESFEQCVSSSKSMIIRSLFTSELKRLVTLSGQDQADGKWMGVTVPLPVYRTYADQGEVSAADRATITATGKAGGVSNNFIAAIIDPANDSQRQAVIEWQQLSGPAMAKGLEDCSHYRYTPLMALNEVGCPAVLANNDAGRFFHWLDGVTGSCPHTLKATSTHDTKRSEDARARLYALADRPEAWVAFVRAAMAATAKYKTNTAPSVPAEYMLYQALVATWPFDGVFDDAYAKRISGFMEKALREARRETSWMQPDEAYERAAQDFTAKVLRDDEFRKLLHDFVEPVARAGAINALAVQTIKILTPGVPDIYQGTEFWDFSLVDPDNRRAVDFAAHKSSMGRLEGSGMVLEQFVRDWQSGLIKAWLTKTLLRIRSALPPDTKAEQLAVHGQKAAHIVAYRYGSLAIAVPRFPGRLLANGVLSLGSAAWGDTMLDLPTGIWKNLLDGRALDSMQAVRPVELFAHFPVAVLEFMPA